MASRRLARRWLLRDIPQFLVLSAGIAAVFGIVAYFVDWSLVRRDVAASPNANIASQLGTSSKSQISNAGNAEIYTGSIILVPPSGEQCLERAIDNRTGQMWDKGYVNCYDFARTAEKSSGLSAKRMRSIGNAFLHKADD